MKPIYLTKALLALAVFAINPAFAQQQNTGAENYHIKIEKDENGKKEVIDKNFTSKEDMNAFLQEINEVPELPEPPMPPAPPEPPAVSALPNLPDMPEGADGFNLCIVKDDNGKMEVTNLNFSTHEEMEAYMKQNKITAPNILSDDIKADGKQIRRIVIIDKEESNTTGGNKPTTESKHETVTINKTIIHTDKTGQTPPGGSTGLSEAKNINDVRVYPNPSDGHFYVDFNVVNTADVTVRLTDMEGKEVYSETMKNFQGPFAKSIYSHQFAKGTYLLEVTAGNEKSAMKVAVQ
jgi:hypothetical protein